MVKVLNQDFSANVRNLLFNNALILYFVYYEVLFDICTHHLTPLKKVIATMLHDIALQR
jgi:hypothetical protein